MFFVAVQAWPRAGGDEFAVYPQVGVAPCGRPFGQIGVIALACLDQGGQYADMASGMLLQNMRNDLFRPLRFHGDIAMRAILGAQFHVKQAQEMMDFRHGGNRGFPASPAGALFYGHGGRYAVNGVYIGFACRLHDGPSIGVQRFQVTALAFIEEDVEGQGGLARA